MWKTPLGDSLAVCAIALAVMATGAALPISALLAPSESPRSSPRLSEADRLASPASLAGPRLVEQLSSLPRGTATPLAINETTLSGFGFPSNVLYDPVNGHVYVSNFGAYNVSVIDPATDRVITWVPMGGPGGQMVCDTVNGDIFVGAGSDVVVISGRTNSVISRLYVSYYALGFPVAYDAQSELVYSPSHVNASLYALNGTAVVSSLALPGLVATQGAYDSNTEQVWATSIWKYSTNFTPAIENVSIINGTNNHIIGSAQGVQPPSQMVYVPALRDMYSAGEQGNLTVLSDITDREVALLPLDHNRYGGNLGGEAYDSRNGLLYVTNRFVDHWCTGTNPSCFTGNGTNIFAVNTTTNTLVQNISVGKQPIGIAYDDRTNELFVADSVENNVTVINLTSTYHIQFVETGLPSGVNWSATINGQTRTGPATLQFVEPNGTFSYEVPTARGYAPTLANGAVQVSGADVQILVKFQPPSFPLTVHESGLPAGTNWSVALAGRSLWSSSSEIVLSVSNGTYPFNVGEVVGYGVSPRSGMVTMNGAALSVILTFSKLSASGSNVFLVYLDLALASVLAVLMATFVLIGRGRKRWPRDQAGRATNTKLSIPGS